ncbi:MAG: 4-alpha-glucanotransferase, partial [Actinomycetota bacterium]|nr:4-alpha-glucanotransferase [Actinomycetota bacterium]
MDAGAWGVAERYQRADGEWVDAPEATLDAILGSMGAGDGDRPPDSEGVCVVHAGQPVDFGRPVRLTTEDGGDLDLDGPLPPDVPLGYHTVTDREDGSEVRLIVSPGRSFLPEGRGWGWAVQLYAVRSRESWGIGDLADLRRIGKWSAAELGARLLLLNPLHAALPGLPQTASPY